MKKRIITLTAAMLIAIAPAMSQVFIMDDDEYNRVPGNGSMIIANPVTYGSGEDWYVPIEGGALLLAGLAGAYLIGKKKKEAK